MLFPIINMNLPNYYDGSIVNLMSSIEESFGSKSKDKIENKKEKIYIGYHGGITKEEMIVPLIVIKNSY